MSAGIQLKLEPFGFPAVESAIKQIVLKAGHLQVAFEVAGKYLVTRTHEHFERHESPEGDPWRALAPATIAARQRMWARKGRGKRGIAASAMAGLSGKTGLEPLQVTGRLMLQSANYSASDRELSVGTNYHFPAHGGERSGPAIHQLGGVAGRGAKIPARPFLGVNERDEERIGDFLMDYLKSGKNTG